MNIQEYYQYPYRISETLVVKGEIPYPDITICPAFPFPTVGNHANYVRQHMDDAIKQTCFDTTEKIPIITKVSYNVMKLWAISLLGVTLSCSCQVPNLRDFKLTISVIA